MDSFAQAAVYLQPSLDFVAKLSSIIPVWMMMVMADKHLLGLPLLGGSVWYSPRIPPRLTISSGRGGEHASGLEFGRRSASPGPSPLERDLPSSTTPFQALHLFSDYQPQGASSATALTLHQPLEAHDPLVSSSGWLEHGYVGGAVLLVVVISCVAVITRGRWYRNTSNTQTSLPELFAHGQHIEEMEFPTCWDSILEDLLSDQSDETLEETLDQPSTPMKTNEDEYISPPKMIAGTATKVKKHMDFRDDEDETLVDSLDQPSTPMKTNEDEQFSPPKMITDTVGKAKRVLVLKHKEAEGTEELLEENEKRDQTETVTKVKKEMENLEEEIPEMHNEENGQEEKRETNEVDAITTGGKPGHCAEVGNENGSEAGKRAGKEGRKEGSKVGSKEGGPSEFGNNVGNEEWGSQEEKTGTYEVFATRTGGKPKICAKAGNGNGTKAGEEAGKRYWKKGSKVDVKKDRPSEFGNNVGNEDLEISAMPEGIEKKQRRSRQIAKIRAERKKAAAAEAKKGSLIAFLRGPINCEGIDGRFE